MLTPLHLAIINRRTRLIEKCFCNKDLIDQNIIEFNITNSDGHTPLSLAARNGMTGILELLIESGASITEAELVGKSPKQEAIINGDMQLAKLIDKLKLESLLVLNKRKIVVDGSVSKAYVAKVQTNREEFYFDEDFDHGGTRRHNNSCILL